MDTEDSDIKVANHSEDKAFSHEDVCRSKSSESTSQFDPKLSSREMRKIKYYEDMFAKMASENKSLSSESANTQYTSSSFQKSRSKLSERRSVDQKSEDLSTNVTGYRHDSIDSVYGAASKSSRRSMYKKALSSIDLDYSGSKYLNDSLSNEFQYADGKTLLDNKRLIRVQSMPMVTKKSKSNMSYTDEKQRDEPRPSSVRRPRVSRWDVKSSYSTPTTARSPQTEPVVPEQTTLVDQTGEESGKEDFSDEFADMIIDSKEEEHLKGEPMESKQYTQEQQALFVQTDPTDTYLENDARDLPLDVDDFLNEDLKEYTDQKYEEEEEKDVTKQEEKQLEDEYRQGEEEQQEQEFVGEVVESIPVKFESKLEEQDIMEQAQPPMKKKSNRGRKSRKKLETYTAEAAPEPAKMMYEDEYTPLSIQPEYVEEIKHPPRRTKSQRSRKKKQEYYEERSASKAKSGAKASKTISRNHSGSFEKTDKLSMPANKREFMDQEEEKYISKDNLRMITMEEAEKMINICTRKNMDYEDAKKFIDNLLTSKVKHKNHVEEKNPFLLDPSNIVAPTEVSDQQDPEPVPEDPLQISFKYRLFQTFSKF